MKISIIILLFVFISVNTYAGQTIKKGKTFGVTEEVTNAALHDLVDKATIVRITDADSDTKIDTEEADDEDIIRFDCGGTQIIAISSQGIEGNTDGTFWDCVLTLNDDILTLDGNVLKLN